MGIIDIQNLKWFPLAPKAKRRSLYDLYLMLYAYEFVIQKLNKMVLAGIQNLKRAPWNLKWASEDTDMALVTLILQRQMVPKNLEMSPIGSLQFLESHALQHRHYILLLRRYFNKSFCPGDVRITTIIVIMSVTIIIYSATQFNGNIGIMTVAIFFYIYTALWKTVIFLCVPFYLSMPSFCKTAIIKRISTLENSWPKCIAEGTRNYMYSSFKNLIKCFKNIN